MMSTMRCRIITSLRLQFHRGHWHFFSNLLTMGPQLEPIFLLSLCEMIAMMATTVAVGQLTAQASPHARVALPATVRPVSTEYCYRVMLCQIWIIMYTSHNLVKL